MSGDTASAAGPPSTCARCGRYVGPAYATCPYCGAPHPMPIPLRVLRVLAAVLATLGLAWLWWLARRTEIPLVEADQVGGLMNFAYVRLAGVVPQRPTYDEESGYLGFWLDDGTGEVYVNAYRDVTQALVAQGDLPAVGDHITVAGTLRIHDSRVALTLNAPEHLSLTRPPARPMLAGEVTLLDAGRRVRLAGQVSQVRTPYPGMTLVTLEDKSGQIPVVLDDRALAGTWRVLTVGQRLTVTGAVDIYHGTPQVVPATEEDLKADPPPTPPPVLVKRENSVAPTPGPLTPSPSPQPQIPRLTTLAELASHPVGEEVMAAGHVVALEGIKGGVRATLDDGVAQVTLVLWDRVYGALSNPRALDVGAQVEVVAKVQQYRGDLELVPRAAEAVTVVTAAPAPPWLAVDTLRPQDVGRVVRLRGVLGEPTGFSAGVKVPLSDGTGTMPVVLWSELYQALTPQPQEGLPVEVTGVINLFQGRLELIPRSRYDWRVRPPP